MATNVTRANATQATSEMPIAANASRPPSPVGETLPSLHLPPLTRATLALYAGGSGDHIPLHIDSDFARAAGHPDVFMHGMLGAAYVMRVVTEWVPQECLAGFSLRFRAITYPGESLVASAVVAEVDPGGCVELDVTLRNSEGQTKIAGRVSVEMRRDLSSGE